MYVCICNAVTDNEIRAVARFGANALEDLQRDLGVATCCGKCAPEACRVLDECTQACHGAD